MCPISIPPPLASANSTPLHFVRFFSPAPKEEEKKKKTTPPLRGPWGGGGTVFFRNLESPDKPCTACRAVVAIVHREDISHVRSPPTSSKGRTPALSCMNGIPSGYLHKIDILRHSERACVHSAALLAGHWMDATRGDGRTNSDLSRNSPARPPRTMLCT